MDSIATFCCDIEQLDILGTNQVTNEGIVRYVPFTKLHTRERVIVELPIDPFHFCFLAFWINLWACEHIRFCIDCMTTYCILVGLLFFIRVHCFLPESLRWCLFCISELNNQSGTEDLPHIANLHSFSGLDEAFSHVCVHSGESILILPMPSNQQISIIMCMSIYHNEGGVLLWCES